MTSRGMDAAQSAVMPATGLAAQLRGPAVAVGPEAPVREALARMVAERADIVVVVDGAGSRPLGVLTQRDVIERVVLPGGDLAQAVAGVMTGGVVSLPLAASAHQARLSLARHDLRHLGIHQPHPAARGEQALHQAQAIGHARGPGKGDGDGLVGGRQRGWGQG